MALIYECNKTCYEKQSLRHRIEKKVISEPIPQFRNKMLTVVELFYKLFQQLFQQTISRGINLIQISLK